MTPEDRSERMEALASVLDALTSVTESGLIQKSRATDIADACVEELEDIFNLER